MKLRIHSLAAAFAACIAAPTMVEAAPITWTSETFTVSGSFGQTLNTGQFDTTGTQILAENIGGGALSFDGINFSAGTISMGGGSFGGFHESGGSQNSDLARFGSYGTNGSASTVSLTGLTPGKSYRVQALVYDGRGDGGIPGRRVSFDGIDQGQYANGTPGVTWGHGLLVTGTFVADATTQNFTVEAFFSGASRGGQLNALLVHEFDAAAPVLASPNVTTVTTTTAQANTSLSVVAANITLYWDTVDQGTGPWTSSNLLGNQAVGPVSGAITGLSPDTIYFYRFKAVNTGPDPDVETWSSAGTSFASALTGLSPAGPAATTFSKTEIDVSWTDNFNTETGFVIQRSPNGVDTWTQAGTVAANAGVFYDSGLLPGTTYHYRVFAQNGTGLSDPSAVVSATTTAPDPGIVVQAWYRMGDAGQGADNLPTDSSGNNRHFVNLSTAAATVSPSGGGYANDAYYTFNGTDQGYNSIGYDAPENNVGIEVWVRASDVLQENTHVFGTGTNANGINIGYDASAVNGQAGWFGAVANKAFAGKLGTANYTANTWIHLAVVRDNGISTFYVNGVASGTAPDAPNNATQPRMAATFDNTVFFDGDVAEARIFTFDPGQFNPSLLLYPGTGPTDPYDIWADTFPSLGNSSADLDFDNGGLPTGIEWVTGGDPSVGSDDPGFTPTFSNTHPSNFLFTFRRRDSAAGDPNTSIVVEYGSNLTGWAPAQHGVNGVTINDTTNLGGGFHQVTVSIPRSLAGPGGKLFARMRVVRQQP